MTRRDFSIGKASAIAISCGVIEDVLPALSATPRQPILTDGPTEVAQVSSSPTADIRPREADALVLGAGIAGLAAARTLVDQSLSVILLEARDRIGGRLWIDTLLGLPLDLGASWIHGIKRNLITKLADQFGVETVATDYDNCIVYNFDGRKISDKEYIAAESLFESIYALHEQEEIDMSLQQAFDRVLKNRTLSDDQLHKLQFVIEGEYALELGADPDHLSLWEWDQDGEFSGLDVVFPKGYNQITDGLANGLDTRLATKVELISYGANGVAVETSSGSFVADKAIVTFPLGVLKQAAVKFDPPLPAWKQSAIDRLDMGVLNKVYLKFPNVFWDETFEEISYMGERTGEWCDWLNFMPYINEPVLMAFHGGTKGFTIEELSDAEIIAGAMKILRVIYGDGIPEPDGFLITRWGKDPLAFGSYSYIPPIASGDDYDALFKPVEMFYILPGRPQAANIPLPCMEHIYQVSRRRGRSGKWRGMMREVKRVRRLTSHSFLAFPFAL